MKTFLFSICVVAVMLLAGFVGASTAAGLMEVMMDTSSPHLLPPSIAALPAIATAFGLAIACMIAGLCEE